MSGLHDGDVPWTELPVGPLIHPSMLTPREIDLSLKSLAALTNYGFHMS